MESLVLTLVTAALQVAVLIALPVVIAVAAVGVAIGLLQTIAQVQDQNVAFAPKLVSIALLAWFAGPAAFGLVRTLLVTAIASLPAFARP